MRPYRELDVFCGSELGGNPLAVVCDGSGLSTGQMQRFARWTNLSETTFLLPPTDPAADYQVRIFTPMSELPFAGHPTLGSCAAWLAGGGQPRQAGRIVQQCGVGLVALRQEGAELAFCAPPVQRGAVDDATLAAAGQALGLAPGAIRAALWLQNGPRWLGLQLADAGAVLDIVPDHERLRQVGLVGVIGALAPGALPPGLADDPRPDFVVRAFCAAEGIAEDPVTGSLNAALAQWLVGAGMAPPRYVVSQGTCIGRQGRVRIAVDADGTWVGGRTELRVEGTLHL